MKLFFDSCACRSTVQFTTRFFVFLVSVGDRLNFNTLKTPSQGNGGVNYLSTVAAQRRRYRDSNL